MRKPYVTQLIGQLDKPALLKWANGIGLKGITLEASREESLGKGKAMHEQIERRLKTGVAMDDPQVGTSLEAFLLGRKILAVEKVIETDLFIGRLDLQIEEKGRPVICDFKAGSRIYFEQVLQLVAYRMAEGDCDLAIIETPTFKLKRVEVKDFTPFEEMLKSLSSIYHNRQLAEWKE